MARLYVVSSPHSRVAEGKAQIASGLTVQFRQGVVPVVGSSPTLCILLPD